MEALEYKIIFSFQFFGYQVGVSETVVVSWIVMALIILVSFIMTRRLKWKPAGPQALLETAVAFLNGFSLSRFGEKSRYLGHYIGTLFLFLLVGNFLPVFSPVAVFGYEPSFVIKPPARDINVTACLAVISIALVLVCGLRARGLKGWIRRFAYPVPMMIPFNILEYGIRPLSLCLRLFGNILGAFILMHLIERLIPIGVPMVFSLYFDFIDGLIQAAVFVFLSSLYIAEAMDIEEV
ncbi:MAG: F0F1 ATP synthase subunit A [Spirochaetales bacterium]|jgi:F-type H+-transporting ATPase subunit a|nr:F0F1 ATP synthase subunit A [Spirochaetales bacterium]